ncbi:glycoside hydrolase family 2 TIM barrel-domain containing protein [Bacteroidota bacterium]
MNFRFTGFLSLCILFGSCSQMDNQLLYIPGIENPRILLNGQWELNLYPDINTTFDTLPDTNWKNIQVPGEVMMQGFAIKHNDSFVYRKRIRIPHDYDGDLIKLRFEGVYSYCRVWIDGNYIRDHSGGFTSWECDITPYVQAGTDSWLFVEVTDKADEISYASGYAKHPIGGILRNVWLTAYPQNYPEQVFITTDLDDDYRNASLQIRGKLRLKGDNAHMVFKLYDDSGSEISLTGNNLIMDDNRSFEIEFLINNPDKWDSEHPDLYRLMVTYYESDDLIWKKNYRIGFREIEISGKKLLVNGEAVKLRGACRHDIHPTLGRVSTPEYDSLDVQLALDANMNFIRTSHYPPTEYFLDQCDKYGIYVEDETAVCFVGSHRTEDYMPSDSQSDSTYAERYLSQLTEMVDNHRNHPSVIIWSIGNENRFGSNFQLSYDWVKENDPSRPVMFSYPGLVPEDQTVYDIISMHYPTFNGNLNQYEIQLNQFETEFNLPVLNDEWAHVACYCKRLVKEDPNIRDFWGMSLDSMWHYSYESESSLGGAIWGMIDEVFMLPDTLSGFNEWWGIIHKGTNPQPYEGHTIGYGEWGIIDTWRRKKPEFWNTKKAYTPVKFLQTEFPDYKPGQPLKIPVYNRFNHTNINELKLIYRYQGKDGLISSPDLQPSEKGFLLVPITNWVPENDIVIEVINGADRLLDVYRLTRNNQDAENLNMNAASSEIDVEDTDQKIVLKSDHFKLSIDKSTGLINNLDDKLALIQSGPYLNLRTKGKILAYTVNDIDNHSLEWKLNSLQYHIKEGAFNWKMNGTYDDDIAVEFNIDLSATGVINVEYTVGNVPDKYIRELGVRFILFDQFDSLEWNRKGYWSYYPPTSLSSSRGSVALVSTVQNRYRQQPLKDWIFDTKSFYYNGTSHERIDTEMTNISKGSKENIYEYKLSSQQSTKSICVSGNGDITCRIARIGENLILYINNHSDYVDLSWGNYQRNLKLPNSYTGDITLSILNSN